MATETAITVYDCNVDYRDTESFILRNGDNWLEWVSTAGDEFDELETLFSFNADDDNNPEPTMSPCAFIGFCLHLQQQGQGYLLVNGRRCTAKDMAQTDGSIRADCEELLFGGKLIEIKRVLSGE